MAIPTIEIIGLDGKSAERQAARKKIEALAKRLEGLRAIHVLFLHKEDHSAEVTVFTSWSPKDKEIIEMFKQHFGICETTSLQVDKLGGLSGLRPNEVTAENKKRLREVQERGATHKLSASRIKYQENEMDPAGFEPAASTLRTWRSTAELQAHWKINWGRKVISPS